MAISKKIETRLITKAKMVKWENVRRSGSVNMHDLANVMNLSKLTEAECKDILRNYDKYMKEFKIEEGE